MNAKIRQKITNDGTEYFFSDMSDENTAHYVTKCGKYNAWIPVDRVTVIEKVELPDWAVGYCHYCGGLAVDFDFFDVPVCRQCGGR